MGGLKIETAATAPPAMLVADRRLYLDVTREQVVEEGDPRAAYLFAAAGREISAAECARLRLAVADGRVVQLGAEVHPEPEAPPPPAE